MLVKINNHVLDTTNIAHVDLDQAGVVVITLNHPTEYWGGSLRFTGADADKVRKFFASATAGVVDTSTAK